VAGGRAYAGNFGGKLVCADLAEKKILWQYGDGESEFYSSPALGPREVVIGCRDNKVHCVGRDDGKPIWTFATRGNVDSSPVICGDKVVVGSADGRLYLLRLADGKQLWSFDVGRSVTAAPAVVGGWVVVGGEDGTVYAFSGPR
jgi:outer membrane protein assembly factor BamB